MVTTESSLKISLHPSAINKLPVCSNFSELLLY